MAQPSNERRFGLRYEPLPQCRLCESPRITCVGLVEDVGFFRCAHCEVVFTIHLPDASVGGEFERNSAHPTERSPSQ